MNSKNKIRSILAVSAALWGMGAMPNFSNNNKFSNGPCKKCGKPNVKRGRETGIYLCEACFLVDQRAKQLTLEFEPKEINSTEELLM